MNRHQMEENSTPVALDRIDLRILGVLQQDASHTNQQLANLVHVSPATCLRRVRRLCEAGVIESSSLTTYSR
jgi:Lrp/AsnC family transcriptional regulator, leucine-responsive regulatory protein